MNYKRVFIQNSFVFITIVTYNRNKILTNYINLLRYAFKKTKENYDFEIIAIGVMPDHLHMILNPKDIYEYPKIISSIKYCFSRRLNIVGQVCPTYDRAKLIWQRRYYEHTILDKLDLNNHIDYIHYNSVKHGYVKVAKNWKYSSFHNFVKQGNYDIDWGNSIEHIAQMDLD